MIHKMFIELNMSGLDERVNCNIKTMLQNGIKQTPAAVIGKVKITLHDSQPKAYKFRPICENVWFDETVQV